MSVAMGTALFASSHIRLVNEGSSGPLYECDTAMCAPAQTDNPVRQNLDQMDFYVLPAGCVTLASAVLRPDGPGVDVDCGPAGDTTRYRCEAGSCRVVDPAVSQDSAIVRPIPLPADCGGKIHELIVIGAATDAPVIYIECDASSGSARGL
jgi:hypothetical protein